MSNSTLASLRLSLHKIGATINTKEKNRDLLVKNISKIEKDIATAKTLLRDYKSICKVRDDIKDYQGTVRLKKVNGNWEFRGESKSRFKNNDTCMRLLHGKRHTKEAEQARKNLTSAFEHWGYGKLETINSSKIDDLIEQKRENFDKFSKAPAILEAKKQDIEKGLETINQEISTLKKDLNKIEGTRKGLTAIYGTNVGAKEINNRIRKQFGLRLETKLAPASSVRGEAHAEWNRSHKDSPYIMASQEDLNYAVSALKKGPDTVLEFMFDVQKREQGTQYRGTMYNPHSGIGTIKRGEQFQIGFIMSCNTTKGITDRYTSTGKGKYHSSDDPANKGQLRARYIIEGKPFNIGAGDTEENERNYKPGTQFILMKEPYNQNGVTCFELKEASTTKKNIATVYR
ncbi:hypothetical protein [Vibrio tetraodonis]|uniref:hypothetical protein n=1 Tax=Vibrio tetraodonis TaxID=2231647 RepID=UPI000E0BFF68|nr:hypothetical protein [Vibrio tetraodonis]